MSGKGGASLWPRLRDARVPQLLGVYGGGSFGVLQGADIFVDRLGLPGWTFFGLVVVLVLGIPVIIATALVQHARKAEGAPEPNAPSRAVSGEARLRRIFTWRNTGFAGLGALGLLAGLVGLFMALRALGIGPVGSLVAAGVLEDQAPILIADFQSHTGDPLLAGAITEVFRIDFEQSPRIRVVSPGAVREGLSRMLLPPDTPLTPEVARDLALREGFRAVLLGEINPAGRGMIVSVRLVTPGSEETVVSFRESVPDSASVIPAVDLLSNRMRERIGESLRSIRGGEPLEQVSTASLQALRRYSQGVRAVELERDFATGIALLEEAVAEDSTFAMAWRKLGVALMNGGYPRERWEEAFTRAYRQADRLTDRERYMTHGTYYSMVVEEPDRAIAAYRALLDLYPLETAALNNLAGLLSGGGDHAGAAELFRRAIAVDSSRTIYYSNLLSQEVSLGEWEEAARTLERFRERFPHLPTPALYAAHFAAARGEYEEAANLFRQVGAHPRVGVQEAATVEGSLANLALLQGRPSLAEVHLDRLMELRRRMGWPVNERDGAFHRARIELLVLRDTATALRRVNEAIGRQPLTAEDVGHGAHLHLAEFFLDAGEVERARGFLEEWDRAPIDVDVRRRMVREREDLGVQLAAEEGRLDEALAHFRRRQAADGCGWCLNARLAWYHDRAAAADSAIAYGERYVTGDWLHRLDQDAVLLPWAHERLGELYEAQGDAEGARRHFQRFADLWHEAEPPLQPRVEAARRRLESPPGTAPRM